VVQLRLALIAPALIAAGLIASIAAAEERDPEVRVTVVPSAGVVEPGGTLTVAVHYVVEPGWHIYWENPGDSGLATTVALSAPDGWTVDPVQYPAPHRFVDAAGLVTYGWEGSVALLVDLTAGADPGPAELRVATRWLVCKESCVVGDAERASTVVVGAVADSAPVVAGREARFAEWRAALPSPLPETSRWVCTELGAILHLWGREATVGFVPGARFSEAGGAVKLTSPTVGLRHDRTDGCSVVENPSSHHVELRVAPPFDRGIQAGPWGILTLDDESYTLSPSCTPVPLPPGDSP